MLLQPAEGMSSRKRRPNWTDQESLLLAQLMQEKREILRGKYSTGISIQDKRQAWVEIAQTINAAFPHVHRTVSDCNKKWENLQAKAREDIRRQKMQMSKGESLSLDQFCTVTQIVISVMNLSEMLQLDREDFSASEQMESQQNSCDQDGNYNVEYEGFPNKRHMEEELPFCPDPAIPLMEQKANITKLVTVHFNGQHAGVCTDSGEHLDTSSSASPPSAHCTTLQERTDLEMSVLRKQEAVLNLQQEYYTLKIKLMKKQMEESAQKN